jgi:hypothetical protein
VRPASVFVLALELFDSHILELARLEDFAALLALDIFGVFVARDDLHSWVLALVRADFLRRSRLDTCHKLRALTLTTGRVDINCRKMPVF